MHHLGMTYKEVLKTPMVHVSLLVSESTPKYDLDEKESDEVEIDTYNGKVKAKKVHVI